MYMKGVGSMQTFLTCVLPAAALAIAPGLVHGECSEMEAVTEANYMQVETYAIDAATAMLDIN